MTDRMVARIIAREWARDEGITLAAYLVCGNRRHQVSVNETDAESEARDVRMWRNKEYLESTCKIEP